MGEANEARKGPIAQAVETMVAQTMGGRMQVRWDESAQATPHGQLVFFAEFLATAGVFDRWRALLAYTCDKIVGHNPLLTPPPVLAASG
ncbi:MAG TPA: hypothetical protein VN277_04145 [Acidiferrobacterales bacterium]|nr:hypothetical protein [Acidiferrobacterales bacterium]